MCFTSVTSLICLVLLRVPTKGRVPLTGQTERHMWLLEIKLIPCRSCPMCQIKRSSLEGQIHFVLLWKEYPLKQDRGCVGTSAERLPSNHLENHL